MGREIDRDTFTTEDHRRFAERLPECLEALRVLLQRPGFGVGATSLGAEVEMSLVDAGGRPLPRGHEVLATPIPRVALELDRFNLEFETHPAQMIGRPFARLADEMRAGLATVRRAAEEHGGRPALVGILPTLRAEDLGPEALTDQPRFRALSAGIRRLRREPFRVAIAGPEHLSVACDDVTLEGASTSLQLHLRVAPDDFAATYNAAQIASAPALAVAGNSPILLERRLWEETRIALFAQAVDDRAPDSAPGWPARVSFGNGWVREGAAELFSEVVALHAPLLPVLGDEDPLERARAGETPGLDELCLHNGTVWRWNRAIYDPADGGHLRVELRALPSGPTIGDMVANAAFLVGLTLGLAPEVDWMTVSLPFPLARRNFYRAAQRGLDAEILWPSPEAPSPRPERARDLVLRLVPTARTGLLRVGVDAGEADALLARVAERAETGGTGACWQAATLRRLEPGRGRSAALAAMLERYLELSASDVPVHEWPH